MATFQKSIFIAIDQEFSLRKERDKKPLRYKARAKYSFCTAHMKVSEDIETGEVYVNCRDYHTGHDNETCHLRVP